MRAFTVEGVYVSNCTECPHNKFSRGVGLCRAIETNYGVMGVRFEHNAVRLTPSCPMYKQSMEVVT